MKFHHRRISFQSYVAKISVFGKETKHNRPGVPPASSWSPPDAITLALARPCVNLESPSPPMPSPSPDALARPALLGLESSSPSPDRASS
jgi:hypothetical protein